LLGVDAEGYLDWVWEQMGAAGLQAFSSAAKRRA